jgi:hypothetical protein
MADIQEELQRLESVEILYSDLEYCRQMLKENNSQFWRRTYVRNFFATIEGMINSWKTIALLRHFEGSVVFSPAEIMFLEEKEYRLEETGKIRVSPGKLSTLSNLRFGFASYAKAFGVEYKLDCSVVGWEKFKDAQRIRDRVTHPKTSTELNISDQEIQTIKSAVAWLGDSREELQGLVFAKLTEKTERYQENIEKLEKQIEDLQQRKKKSNLP